MGRIKSYLDTLVGQQQSAFIPDMHISDNILLVQELLRGYHRGNGEPQCALKVDT